MVIVTIVVRSDGRCSVLSFVPRDRLERKNYGAIFAIGALSYIRFPMAMGVAEARAALGSDTYLLGGLKNHVPVRPEVALLILKTLEDSPLFSINRPDANMIRHRIGEQHVRFQDLTPEDDDDRDG